MFAFNLFIQVFSSIFCLNSKNAGVSFRLLCKGWLGRFLNLALIPFFLKITTMLLSQRMIFFMLPFLAADGNRHLLILFFFYFGVHFGHGQAWASAPWPTGPKDQPPVRGRNISTTFGARKQGGGGGRGLS